MSGKQRTDTERLDWFAENPHNVLAHEFQDRSLGPAHSPREWPLCDCGLELSLIALRELASIAERAEKLDRYVTSDVDILSTDERPSFEEWDAIVRLLAAGFSTAPNGAKTND